MAKAIPNFSKGEINRAGNIIISTEEPAFEEAMWASEVLTNWRSSHVYPINTFQATLRNHLSNIDEKSIVAQRIKRTPSIVRKLRNEPHMKLSTMQDIGGLRAVVQNVDQVYALVDSYEKSTRLRHELVKVNDYIRDPKRSGYRSVHLIYKYFNVKVPDYNGLRIEIQVRSKIQHAWATSVETMGAFLKHALKSSEGPQDWLYFFALAGSAFAHYEGCQPAETFAHLSKAEVYKKLAELAATLHVAERLDTFRGVVKKLNIGEIQGHYHLITLDVGSRIATIKSFGRRNLESANKEYTEIEKEHEYDDNIQVVLVSAGNIAELARAYPNYFLDTQEFIHILKQIR